LIDLCCTNSYMRLRTSKYLIRIAFIFIAFQFIAPGFLTEAIEMYSFGTETTFHKHTQHSLTYSSLFEKIEKESEEEDTKHTISTFVNLSDLYFGRISASQAIVHSYTVFRHIQEPALFDLHCVYLI
jgi:hypothetical protein